MYIKNYSFSSSFSFCSSALLAKTHEQIITNVMSKKDNIRNIVISIPRIFMISPINILSNYFCFMHFFLKSKRRYMIINAVRTPEVSIKTSMKEPFRPLINS